MPSLRHGPWCTHWARTTLEVELQRYQYKKVASEIAAEGVDRRRQLRAESANFNKEHETLKEYSQRKLEGDVACLFAEGCDRLRNEGVACQEAVVCCVVCGLNFGLQSLLQIHGAKEVCRRHAKL